MNQAFEKIKQDGKEMKSLVRQQTLSYLIAALGLVAGLAWNDAIKVMIEKIFPNSQSMLMKFVYAILVTLVAVSLTMYLTRLIKNNDQKDQ